MKINGLMKLFSSIFISSLNKSFIFFQTELLQWVRRNRDVNKKIQVNFKNYFSSMIQQKSVPIT